MGFGIRYATSSPYWQYYYFGKNIQGDVIALYRSDYNSSSQSYYPTLVATYSYDPWGTPTGIYDANGNAISQTAYNVAAYNPFRYRGYRYDGDTRLYYLQSRYYDPAVGRFINADSPNFALTNPYSDGITDKNYFAYCDNNPVMRKDDGGELFKEIAIGAVVGGIAGAFWGGLTAAATGDNIAKGVVSGAISGAVSGGVSAAAVEIKTIGTIAKATIGAIGGGISAVASYRHGGNANIAGTISAAVTGAASGAISAVMPKSYGTVAGAVVTYFSSGVSSVSTMISSTVCSALRRRKQPPVLVSNRYNSRYKSRSIRSSRRSSRQISIVM